MTSYKPTLITTINNIDYYTIPFSTVSGYAISRCGSVISNKRSKDGSWNFLKLTTDKKSGYLLLTLTLDAKDSIYFNRHASQKSFTLHKLLYSTFISGIDHGFNQVVDHISADRTDNSLSNLQLLTRGENSRKGQADRLLSDEIVLDIFKKSQSGIKMTELMALFPDVCRSTIRAIIHGDHYGTITGLTDKGRSNYKRIAETKAADTLARQIEARKIKQALKDDAKLVKLAYKIFGTRF